MTLAAAMIVKDEQDYLPQCLSSVKGIADEIVVLIDDRTSDKSKKIALESGAKVYDFKWKDDFSAAKNEALKYVKSEWVLFLDADEVIKKNDLKKIKELLSIESNKKGEGKIFNCAFILDQLNYNNVEKTYGWKPVDEYADLGGESRGYYAVPLIRLFRTDLGIKYKYKIHESVIDSIREFNGKIAKLNVGIHHYGDVRDEDFVKNKLEIYDRLIKEQLAETPNDAKAIYQHANQLAANGMLDDAILEYDRVIKLEPKFEMPFIMKGDIYVKKKKFWDAITNYKRACEIAPTKAVGFIKLSSLLTNLGKFDDAYRVLAWAKKFNIDHVAIYNNVGFLLMQQKKYEEAIKIFTTGLNKIKNSADPYYPIMINYLVDSLINVGKRKSAVDVLEQVIARNPNNSESYKSKLDKIR